MPYFLMIAARRCRGEAPLRLRVLNVVLISRVRCSPSIALILANPASPMVRPLAFGRLLALDFPTFFMESS